MFKNVVVGIDGEDGGRDALALARLLCADGGRLTLAHVYPGEAIVWRGANPAYQAVEQEDAEALLERTRAEEKLDADTKFIGASSVGKGLHLLAEDIGADLIVIGSSRDGLLHRVMVGDETRAALNGAPSAVAIAPAGYTTEPHLLRQVGVGYNGSPESEHALAFARQLAEESGATLSAFQAVSVPSYVSHGRTAVDSTPITDLVDEARAQIVALGGVEPHAAYGKPAEELALYSASLDLLVVGSRDFGPLGRLVHGSTTHQLAHSAGCPLLVLTRAVRRTDAERPAGEEPQTALAGS